MTIREFTVIVEGGVIGVALTSSLLLLAGSPPPLWQQVMLLALSLEAVVLRVVAWVGGDGEASDDDKE